jgi:hypothetical protein
MTIELWILQDELLGHKRNLGMAFPDKEATVKLYKAKVLVTPRDRWEEGKMT